jgi:Putative beta-barrel porin-2, OmpL-like. bbp2
MVHTTLVMLLLCAAPDDAGSSSRPRGSSTTDSAGDAGLPTPVSEGFFSRFGIAYWQDWTGTLPSQPDAPSRGFPPPAGNPPFPFDYWPYGGSPTIGAPNSAWSPLMAALYGGPGGDAWKASGIRIHGWLNAGFNLSSSGQGGLANAPAAYYAVSNTWQLDQFTLYVERTPDTVQTDHFDWGFRLAQLVGFDYRYTTMKGIFSQQLLSANNHLGYDPVMFYVDLYWPVLAGFNIRIGRYISLPDIEAQLAPDNYSYSHSLLYTYDAYTQLGVMLTLKLDNHWLFQLGLSSGNDIAFWVKGAGAQPTLSACLSYSWTEGRDNVYLCANSVNDGQYGYNNVQAYYATWYHRFGTGPFHTATEAWYQYEENVPSIFVPNNGALIPGANGAWCAAGQSKCFAPEWAILNYLELRVSDSNALQWRNEYMNDIQGQRTGFKTQYVETLLSWTHWIGSTILLRPEIRFERALDRPAYDNGTARNQFVFAADFILKY